MARLNNRRGRAPESEDEEGFSRESTPISTAPSDRKRMRLNLEPEHDRTQTETPVRSKKSTNPGSCTSRKEPEDRKFALEPKRKHQPGAIVRVKLTNFVTYTSAEFFPGPNLNMVIGPNGTGKSTLVCAICLGLGWGPSLLGRAKDPAEFVKHGTKEATIEIELQRAPDGANKTGVNPVVVRTIRKDGNKSTFYINKQPASNKKVLDLMRTFNIQVDNLCQFLPQDRVVEFAQLNPVQLLYTTLEAAADPEALQCLEQLKSVRAKQQELFFSNKGEREQLESLEKKQEDQRVEVERLRERIVIQKQIDMLEKCKPIPTYQAAKRKVSELKRIKDQLKIDTDELGRQSEPALRKVNEKQVYARRAKENRENLKKEVKRADDECKRVEREISTHVRKMEECVQRETVEKNTSQKDRQNLQKKRAELQHLKARKEQEPEPFNAADYNDKIGEHRNRIRELIQQGEDVQNELDSLTARGRGGQRRTEELSKELGDLNSEAGKQEQWLLKNSKDSYRAWKWLQDNHHLFEKPVFGPPAVTCSVKDQSLAKMVEASLQKSDFKFFTCQTDADFRKLQHELTRKQNLHDISLRTCSLEDLSNFQRPVSDDQLRSLGLEYWAIDCLDGPSQVLAVLCQEKKLHASAISRSDMSPEQHEAISETSLSGYMARGRSCRFTQRREYGDAGKSSLFREIQEPQVWTDQPVDLGRKQEIDAEIKRINIDKHQLKENIEILKQKGVRLMEERTHEEEAKDELEKVKAEKQKALTEWNALDAKISKTEQDAERLKDNLDSWKQRCLDILKGKDKAMFLKANAVLQYCQSCNSLKQANERLLVAEVFAIEAENDYQNLKSINQHIREMLQRKVDELQQAEKVFKEQKSGAEKLMQDVRALHAEATALQIDGDHGLWEFFLTMSKAAQEGTCTEESLKDSIELEHSKLEMMTGGMDADNRIREYEVRARKIEQYRNKLVGFHAENDEHHRNIRNIRTMFEEHAQPVIEQINAAFSDSFARIGCAGQVVLYKASSEDPADCTEELSGQDNGLDFANWAIHISVKFRENEPLSLLDSHRQSGGERAVSTIFYLMALQSLSRSPFRVVDEINQGMDPRNERMVHGRMVDIAAASENNAAAGSKQGSQYFLITPKLLSGLKYERGMTVLCIVSGENMPSAEDSKRTLPDGTVEDVKGAKINFAAFARRARELGLGRNYSERRSGRRVDSGVGLTGAMGVRVGA